MRSRRPAERTLSPTTGRLARSPAERLEPTRAPGGHQSRGPREGGGGRTLLRYVNGLLTFLAIAMLALGAAAPHLLPYGSRGAGPAFAVPHGIVLLIGVLCFVLFLAEGAVLDWSAVALASIQGLDVSHAGLGYALFSLTMTVGRLTGDRFVARIGGTRIVVLGGICASAGFATAALVQAVPIALLGYALVGAGAANIVPVLFSRAGRQTVMPEHIAVPAITTLGYAGVLVFNPGGQLIGRIRLPEVCANLCFGGPKRDRLFMAASQSLYAVYLATQGAGPG